jgi:NodT family efflux transporter outer membrane factor (OMF) lipoprotein
LSLQAELATDYFTLSALDAQKKLLDSTVTAFEKALDLTRKRHDAGIASGADVAQAETQLETTRAQALDVGVQRAQFEHAIALLVGQSASTFSLSSKPIQNLPPNLPPALPSELLERRPDIAAAERRVAAANAQIGVTQTAFFPALILNATGGFESNSFAKWLNWPSRFWSLGPSLLQTVFDGGKRRAISDQAWAAYDATVANYRESVLAAFQEVEDNLAALRILTEEAQVQDAAVKAAERSLEISNDRYQGGIVAYLEVLTAQSALLENQRTAVTLLQRKMTTSVLLIKALGGGWNIHNLAPNNSETLQSRK